MTDDRCGILKIKGFKVRHYIGDMPSPISIDLDLIKERSSVERCSIGFVPDGEAVPPLELMNGSLSLHLPISHFSAVIDTLRHEQEPYIEFTMHNKLAFLNSVDRQDAEVNSSTSISD